METSMITLYHAPRSRSSRVIGLIHAMGIADRIDIRLVHIPRQDGSGHRDPANPHPEGKVPLLDHDGVAVWETSAILAYLTELFPDSPLGIPPGDKNRGRFLSWLHWYGAVMEPALILDAAGVSHPWMTAAIRGRAEVLARLDAALTGADWLAGGRYTAADLICASAFQWFRDPLPGHPTIKDWVDRCGAQPWSAAVARSEAEAMARLTSAAA
jgi:glutathione S-transferase